MGPSNIKICFQYILSVTCASHFILMTVLCPYVSEGLDLLEACKKTDDSHVTRGNFTCCSGSPQSLPLQSSLDFETGWKKCAMEPESVNEDPVISAWRVYRCIIFQGIHGKPLLPSTFTELMASNYPALIRTQILTKMSELEGGTMKFDVDTECLKRTPYPKVHLLHNLFYDTEQEICESGNNDTDYNSNEYVVPRNRPSVKTFNMKRSSWSETDLEYILCETCNRRKELYHRNGDCCSHVSIPFPFIYLPYRYGNNDRVNQCAEDLADDVGLPTDTEFSSHLQYLCYASCEFYLGGVLEESDLWEGIQALQSSTGIRTLTMKMMPKYISSKYKEAVLRYVLANFRLAWDETKTFESRIQLSQMDARNCDRGKLKNLLASCKTHRLIETIMNLYFNNLCLENYPLNEPNATTPKSLIHAFNNLTTPASTAVSNDEVTLNFEWGTPSRNHNHHHHHSYDADNKDFDGFGRDLIFNFRNQSSNSPTWGRPSTMPPTRGRGQYIRMY